MNTAAPAASPTTTLSTPEQAALMALLLRHEHPRALVASLVIAAHWDPATNRSTVMSAEMAAATGRGTRTASRYKNCADGRDRRDSHRSKIWAEVKATPQGTVYRLGGRGQELWAENGFHLLAELQGYRVMTGVPLLEDLLLGPEGSQEDLDAAYGITYNEVIRWEARIDAVSYEAAASAAGVVGGLVEAAFSLSLRYPAATDHSLMGYVASTMGKDGTVSPSHEDSAHYADIKNVKFVTPKERRIVEHTGLWSRDGEGLRYSGRGLALRAAWSRLQDRGLAVDV